MKIMIFTEGTITMHSAAQGLSREEIVEQSKQAGLQREERSIQFNSTVDYNPEPRSVYDYGNYIPNGESVRKLTQWKQQGATIYYLTSRRTKPEVELVKNTLNKYNFPDVDNLYFRQEGEDYKDVAERIMPDILIEDDCESIGGAKEMTYTHIKPELKQKIKSIVVKEFEGIDHLPDSISLF